MWSCWQLIFCFVVFINKTIAWKLQRNDSMLEKMHKQNNENFTSLGYKFPIIVPDEDYKTNAEDLIFNSSNNALEDTEPHYFNLQNVTYQNSERSNYYKKPFNAIDQDTEHRSYIENNITEAQTKLVNTIAHKNNTNDLNFTNHNILYSLITGNVSGIISENFAIGTEPVKEENITLNETQEEGGIKQEFDNQPHENIKYLNISRIGGKKAEGFFRKKINMTFKTPQDNNTIINYKNMMIDLIVRLNSKVNKNKRTQVVDKPTSNEITKKYFKQNKTQNPIQLSQISSTALFLEPKKDLIKDIFLQNLFNKFMNNKNRVQRKRTLPRKFQKMSAKSISNEISNEKILAIKIKKLRSQMFEILLTIEQIKRQLQEKNKLKRLKDSKQHRRTKNHVNRKQYDRLWKKLYLRYLNRTNLEEEDFSTISENFLQKTNAVENFFKKIIYVLTKICNKNENINKNLPKYSGSFNEYKLSKDIYTNEIRHLKNLLHTFNIIHDRFIKNINESIENIDRTLKETPTSNIYSKFNTESEANIETDLDYTFSIDKTELVKDKAEKVIDRRRRRKISDSAEAPVKYILGLMGALLNESLKSNENIDAVLDEYLERTNNATVLTEEMKHNVATTHKTDAIKEDNVKYNSEYTKTFSNDKRNSDDEITYVGNEETTSKSTTNQIVTKDYKTTSKSRTNQIVTKHYKNFFPEEHLDFIVKTNNNATIITKENEQEIPITHATDVTAEGIEKYSPVLSENIYSISLSNEPKGDVKYAARDRNDYVHVTSSIPRTKEIIKPVHDMLYSEEDIDVTINITNNANIPTEETKHNLSMVNAIDFSSLINTKLNETKYNPGSTETYSTNKYNSDDMSVANEKNNYVYTTSSTPHLDEYLGVNVNKTNNSTIYTEEIKHNILIPHSTNATKEDIEKFSDGFKERYSTNKPNSDDMYVNTSVHVIGELPTERSVSQNLYENNRAYQETIVNSAGIPDYATETNTENRRHSRLFFYTNDDDLTVPMKDKEDISTTDVPIMTTDSSTEFVSPTVRPENYEITTTTSIVEENTIGNDNAKGLFMKYNKVYNNINEDEEKINSGMETVSLPDETFNSNTNLQNIYKYENAGKDMNKVMNKHNQGNNAVGSDYQQFKNGYHFNSEGFLESITEEAESHTIMNKILRRKNKLLLDYLDYGDNESSVTANVLQSENVAKTTNINAENNEDSNKNKAIAINLQKETNEGPYKETENKKVEKSVEHFDEYQETPTDYADVVTTQRINEPVLNHSERVKVNRPATYEQDEEKTNYGMERDTEAFLDDVEAEDSESYFVI